MKQAQGTTRQILLAMVGIQQHRQRRPISGQQPSHGVHAEIPPRQIVLQTTKADHRVGSR